MRNILWLCLILALSLTWSVHAIVIRHDQSDSNHRADESTYPAVVRFEDGAGVLVGSQWVLTAAHVASLFDRGYIRTAHLAGESVPIAEVIIHPDWTMGGPHDIALVRLKRDVTGITPVKLYQGTDEKLKTVRFVGWGDTGDGQTGVVTQDGIMRFADNVVSDVDDAHLYFKFDSPPEALELEGVSGPGDSGGPALLEVDGVAYTLGVSAMADGTPGKYGVTEIYPRVSQYHLWLTSVMTPSDDSATEEDAIRQAGQTWTRYYQEGDLDGLMMLYEEDAVVALHGQPALFGTEAVRTYFAPRIGQADVSFELDYEVIEVHGDIAYIISKYWLHSTNRETGKTFTDAGRSMLVYKKRDGAWKIAADLDQATPDVSFPSPSGLTQ